MEIKINGKIENVKNDLSIHNYLNLKGITTDLVVVELNKNIVKRETFNAIKLSEGDRLEIFEFVGGG